MKISSLAPLLALLAALLGASWWVGARYLERASSSDFRAASLPRIEPAWASEAPDPNPDGGPAPAAPAVSQAVVELEGGGDRWIELNREAIEALEAGDHDAAIAGFEACLEALPAEPVLSANLAEALVRKALRDHEFERPCGHCPELLARALELAPGRSDLHRLLERWRREADAEAGFWRESSQHFDLAYDGSRDEILWGSHRLLELLEESYDDLGLFFGHYPVEAGRTRFPVALYRRERFDELTGLGDWAGGAFDGTVRVPVGDFELEEARLRQVLRHELVHAFVREVGGTSVPDWLNEGLAQWLEQGRPELLAAARERLAGKPFFPLERLEGSIAQWTESELIAQAYAQSLLFTDHLARNYGEQLVVQLVQGCAAGEPPKARFERATSVPLDAALEQLESELGRAR